MPQDSRVIIPDYTFIAVARAVSMARLQPLFVDVRGPDLNLDPVLVEEALVTGKGRVSAIVAVSSYGRRCDMDAIIDLGRRFDVMVIEDLAEAHGIAPHPETDVAVWSFFRNKVVAAEEGGAVASRWPEVIEKVKSLRSQGYRPGAYWNGARAADGRNCPGPRSTSPTGLRYRPTGSGCSWAGGG